MQETFDRPTTVGAAPPPPGYRSIRQREAARAGTRRLIAVSSVLGIGLVTVGAVMEFSSHRSHTIPVIEADSRPLRVKPENPGGMQVAGAGESILSGGLGTAPETLAPPPETPDPTGLRQQEKAALAREAASNAPKLPDTIQGLSKSGSVALNVPQPPTVEDDGAPLPTTGQSNTSPPVVRPIAPPPQKLAVTQPPPISNHAPQAAAPAPAKPTPAAPAARQPASAEHPQPAGQHAGQHQVQLAALSSQAAANAEWQRLSKLLPDLLANRAPDVTEFSREGHVYWRLRTGGFADAAAVNAFCTDMRAKGFNCTPASF